MNNKTQIRISGVILIGLILISFLPGCKKSPEPLSVEDSNMSKEQEEAGINKITIVKIQDGNLVSTAYSPNDISFSLRVVESGKRHRLQFPLRRLYQIEPLVEPNSIYPRKDYHNKYLFPPLERPQVSDPLMD